MTGAGIPVPRPSPDTAPYWEGAQRGELLLPACRSCGNVWFPPSEWCPRCSASEHEWRTLSGRGNLVTFSVVHRAPGPAFAARAPYVIAVVRLDEGPSLLCNIVECPPDQVTIGMQVEVTFERIGDEAVIPQFRPRRD